MLSVFVSNQLSNSFKCFLLVTLPHMNDIILISVHENYKAVNNYHQIFVTLKVLMQNERTQWLTAQTLCSAFVQSIVRVGYSPSLPYYELLIQYYLNIEQLYS